MGVSGHRLAAELFGNNKGDNGVAVGKIRHGCLTAWLVLMIIANAATASMYLRGSGTIRATTPNMPGWALPVLIVASIFSLVCAIAFFQWEKWGFWGICATSVVAMAVNLLADLGICPTFSGLLGVSLLYGTLHIGTDNKGWPQLDWVVIFSNCRSDKSVADTRWSRLP